MRTFPLARNARRLVASVSHLMTDLHGMDELEPPPRLVYAILDKTLGPRESVTGWRAVLAWFTALANPRVGYGFASVAATFLIVVSASGFSWRKPKLADLKPASIYRNADRQVHLVYARGTKFVSDLRVVYEIQSRLTQDEQQNPSRRITGRRLRRTEIPGARMAPTPLRRSSKIVPTASTEIRKCWPQAFRFGWRGEFDEVCRPSGCGRRRLLPELRQGFVRDVRAAGS